MLHLLRIDLIILLLPVIVISCTDSNNNGLKNDETVTSVFSAKEINDLQILFDFFTEKICESAEISATLPSECFESYLASQHESAHSSGNVTIPYSFQEQENIFSAISNETFDQIWKRHSEYGNFLSINIQGKYLKFLDSVSEDEVTISGYKDQILTAGDIGTGAQANMLLFPENFNTSDVRIRLIIAVHFLTISYNDRD